MVSLPSFQDYTSDNQHEGTQHYPCHVIKINWASSERGIQWCEDDDKNANFSNGLAENLLNAFPVQHR